VRKSLSVTGSRASTPEHIQGSSPKTKKDWSNDNPKKKIHTDTVIMSVCTKYCYTKTTSMDN
jgi:hypothetical protein